jgi:hypothetical protein
LGGDICVANHAWPNAFSQADCDGKGRGERLWRRRQALVLHSAHFAENALIQVGKPFIVVQKIMLHCTTSL